MTMTADNKLAIVIPVFNRREVTINCLESLSRCEYQDYKIFICDSGSTDGTQGAVSKFEKVELINVGSDAWWSAAVNKGIKKALNGGFSLILVLNDDISFESDLLNDLLSKHELYPDRIISPAQQSPSGLYFGTIYSGIFKKLTNLTPSDITNDDQAVDTTNGCCLLIPKIVFEQVGLFNENNCPHLYGDTEFQLRAKYLGYTTISTKNILISQLAETDAFKKINICNILSFKGSPLNFNAYLQFGNTLFRKKIYFLFLGWGFIFIFIKVLFKTILKMIFTKVISFLK